MSEPTPEQRAVIDHPLEPLRVAAGAGTGKTATIVWRLAAAVGRGMLPEAALGITFTNKAAEELADRLRGTLPELAAEGREVQVTTYHGFAHQLLDEYGALVGVERGAPVIGAGFQRQLLDESLTFHRYEHVDLTSPARGVEKAASLARQLGDNLMTPNRLVAAAPSLPDEVWEERLELNAIVGTYSDEKRRLGVVDYADLIRLAHDLVIEHPEIAARIRSRYQLVVVDEYQDTDPGQRLLLQRLFGDGFPLTAVGDPDQTIYEWRGASTSNFASFPDHFPVGDGFRVADTLPLTLNRRSDRAILDVANEIRRRMHDDPAFLQPLPEAGPGTVTTAWFRTVRDEASWIADEIRTLHDEAGVPWGAVAVLFRKNRSIAPVREALQAAEIPVDVVSLGGLLSVPEVAELHAWLRAIHDPEDSPAAARILLGGKYRLGLGDLAPLNRWVRERQGERDEVDDAVVPGYPLLEAVEHLDLITGLPAEARRRLEEFARLYRELLVTAQSVTLSELCRRILDALDAWAEVDALAPSAALSARLNLYRFLDRAESWSPLEGRPSLGAFLGYLDALEQDAAAEELDVASPAAEQAVTLMTVHRAKGLEWDAVFLPAVAKGTFPVTSQGYDNPVDYARFLPFELRVDHGDLPDLTAAATPEARRAVLSARHLDQEWRTAYVAVTRARYRLFVSGAAWNGVQKPRSPSELWELVDRLPATVRGPFVDDPGPQPEVLPEPPEPPPDPLFVGGWQEALRTRLDDPGSVAAGHRELAAEVGVRKEQLLLAFEGLPALPEVETEPITRMSVTGLVTMAACPQRYRWAEIDGLPRRPDVTVRRGIDFHRKAELHNLGVIPLDEVSPQGYDAPDEAGSGGPGSFEVFLGSRFAAERPRFVEVPIEIRLPEARVRGRVDAVYERPEAWEIVDYKSGVKRDETTRLVQLQAYAVAAADGAISAQPPPELTVTFAYFGGHGLDESTWSVDEAFLDEARHRVMSLVAQVREERFPATPSAACSGCDFLHFCEAGRRHVGSARAG